jgi:hypothetical protein
MQSRSSCAHVIKCDSRRYIRVRSQYWSGVVVVTAFMYRRTCKTSSTPNVRQQPNSKYQCSCSTLHMATSYKTVNFTRTAVRTRRMTRTTFTSQIRLEYGVASPCSSVHDVSMRGPQITYKVARNRGSERSENVSVAYNFVIQERTPIQFISAAFVTELL